MADPGDFRNHSINLRLVYIKYSNIIPNISALAKDFPIPFSNEECSDYWKPLASEDAFPNPGIKTYSPMVNNS